MKKSESIFEICERSSVRLSYADSNKNGVIDPSTEIIEESEASPIPYKKDKKEAKQLLSIWIKT